MKKMIAALLLVAILAFPVFAESVRLSASVDFVQSPWNASGFGLSVHGVFPLLSFVDDGIKVGPGATFTFPRNDHSNLLIFGTGYFYIPKMVGADGDIVNLYVRANLGYNIPMWFGDGDSRYNGGLGWGTGVGYDITEKFFVEAMWQDYSGSYTRLHLQFGLKF